MLNLTVIKLILLDEDSQGGAPPGNGAILMEDAGYILQEDGTDILLE